MIVGDCNLVDFNNTTQRIQTGPGDSLNTLVVTFWYRYFPDSLLLNRESFVGEVAIGGLLGRSDHEVSKLKIFGDRKKIATQAPTLESGVWDIEGTS